MFSCVFPRFSTSSLDFPRPAHLIASPSKVPVIWLYRDDCGGIVCALITYFLLFYSDFVLGAYIFSCSLAIREFADKTLPSPVDSEAMRPLMISASRYVLFNVFVFLAVLSHVKCMTSDPGAIPRCRPPLGYESQICSRDACSGSFKPSRAHHSSDVGRCIRKFDHFCVWTNAAIGFANLKYFLLFCLYVFLTCATAIAIIVSQFVNCPSMNIAKCFDSGADSNSFSVVGMVQTLLVLMIALLFGLFTFIMFVSQFHCFHSDETQVEQWKNEKKQYQMKNKNKRILPPAPRIIAAAPQKRISEGDGDSESDSASDIENPTIIPLLHPLPESENRKISFSENVKLTFIGDSPLAQINFRNGVTRFFINCARAILPINQLFHDYEAILGVAGLERLE